ncbi:MAG: diguanylate cyclase, partial [Holophagales bacterium]|nr:diguanylate cyclase [Holophagales bacterium]
LWIGTTQGLLRFDGSSFKPFPLLEDRPSAEPEPTVLALLEKDSRDLWVGTSAGLALLDRRSHSVAWWREEDPIHRGEELDVVDLEQDADGSLWAATSHGGLCRVGTSTPELSCWRHDPEDPSSLASDHLVDLELARTGHLWVATASDGLDRCDPSTGRCEHFRHDPSSTDSLPSDRLNTVLEDRHGELWVGTYGDGLYRLDGDGRLVRHYTHHHADPAHPNSRSIKVLAEDAQGRLWIGTWGGGVNVFDRDRERFVRRDHHPDVTDSISDDRVLALAPDRLGRMWVGTYYGLDVHDPARELFLVYRHDADDPSSLRDDRVQSVLEDRRGRLWIGSYHRGLARIDPDGAVRHFEADPDDPSALANPGVWSLHEDATGTIWAGTSRGLHRYLEGSESWQRQQHEIEDPAPFSNNNIMAVAEEPSGALWLGTWAGTLDRFDPRTGEVIQHLPDENDPDSLPGGAIRDLMLDPAGRLWIATNGTGLVVRNPGSSSFERFVHDPEDDSSLGNDVVSSLYLDSRGWLWLATLGGLDRWLPERRTFEHRGEGEYRDVSGIAEDDEGRLWLTTDEGVLCYDPEDGSLVRYDTGDGLQSRAHHVGATRRGPSGRIFAGGADGLSVFDPSRLPLAQEPPRVALTDFRLLNQVVEIGASGSPLERDVAEVDRIVLQPEQYSFGFELAALTPRRPEKVRYAYRLEGVDPDWMEVEASERRVTYTGLPHGDYTFHARAATSAGWSDAASVEVVVLPTWWRSTWFRGLAAATLLAAILGGVRWRLAALEQLNHQLAEMVAERTRELEESARQLEEASLTDPLTGLRNRRFVAQHLAADVEQTLRTYREPAGAAPSETDLVFVLLDLDRFKQLNDHHGHGAGDAVLEQVASVLSRECRASDFVVRWGGEEFMVVARMVDRSKAFEAGDRLRRAISAQPVELSSGKSLRVTCSVGVATFPFDARNPEGFTWEQVVDAADAGLYAAKLAGRDTTVSVAATSNTDLDTLHHRLSSDFQALLDAGELTVARSRDAPPASVSALAARG